MTRVRGLIPAVSYALVLIATFALSTKAGPLITAAVVIYALIIGAALTLAARTGPARMWGIAVVVVACGLWLGRVLGFGVPIYSVHCPLCGHGWYIDFITFGIATGVAALALHAIARRPLSPVVRMLAGAAAAFPVLRFGLGIWVS